MVVTISVVGTRRQCKKGLKSIARSAEYGLIANVVMQRIGFGVWHIQFDASRVR